MSTRSEWSVLTKSVGGSAGPPSADQLERLAELLPGEDAWTQYPPASGRGNSFETRFWVEADDAAAAGSLGCALVEAAQADVGLAGWPIVRLHSASLEERTLEFYPGLEGRPDDPHEWSIMHRAALTADEPALSDDDRTVLRRALGGEDAIVAGSEAMVELRFWVQAPDAVAAAAVAERAVAAAMRDIGRFAWTTMRLQSASAAERRREEYRGVERRLGKR